MELKAKKINGSRFTNEDLLKVVLNVNNDNVHLAFFTIQHVSGASVKHGGGAEAMEYLNYLPSEEIAPNTNEIEIEMSLIQQEEGESIIKVLAKVVLKSTYDTWHQQWVDWDAGLQQADNTDEYREANPEPLLGNDGILSTNNIVLEWLQDNYV